MLTRRALAFNLVGAGLGAGALWLLRDRLASPRPAVSLASGALSSGWIPFASQEEPVLTVPVMIQGRPAIGLFDSGAQMSVIDRGLARSLAAPRLLLPILALGLSGDPQLGPAASLQVQAGQLELKGLRAAELDLAGLGVPAQAAFDVILGQNALQAVVLDIDFPRRRLALYPSQGYSPPPGAALAPARLDRGRLVAQVRVDGTPLEAVVDTGASAILALAGDVAVKAGLLKGRTVREGASVTLGGTTPGRTVVLSNLTFGEASFDRVAVQIYDPPQQALLRPFLPTGLLGLGALRLFRVILNLGAGQLYLMRDGDGLQSRSPWMRTDQRAAALTGGADPLAHQAAAPLASGDPRQKRSAPPAGAGGASQTPARRGDEPRG